MSTTQRIETTSTTAPTPTSYVIQFQISGGNALTASSTSAGAAIQLQPLQGAGSPNQQWVIDPSSGLITLASTFGTLVPKVLDIQGASPTGQSPLVLADFVLGRPYQRWNVVGSPPYILNSGLSNFAIDCNACSTTPGTVIQAYQWIVGDRCQWWSMTSVPTMANALERVRHT